jgi:hypothetical protein
MQLWKYNITYWKLPSLGENIIETKGKVGQKLQPQNPNNELTKLVKSLSAKMEKLKLEGK